MRTVWLALLCLIGLAATVVWKIGMSPYASAVARETAQIDTVALSSENVTAGTNFQTDTFTKLQTDTVTKADKLEVSYTNEAAPEVKSVKSVAIELPTSDPKQVSRKVERIVSRHWHDPFDKRSVQNATKPPAKRKLSNSSTSHSRIVTARAPKS
jgi:Flp pilus assembly protein CpaB